jgi:peptidoglycan hydrolase-like protein with peptidoglycan-binding domain
MKLLKSKILLGVMIFAIMFVGFAVVKTSYATECDLGTVTLKQGMSGTAVACLQEKLGLASQYPRGYFGSITVGLVKSFQTAHSLTADGVVGPLTKAALGVSGNTGTLPAGCVAGALFSSTTGLPCTTTSSPTTLSGGAGDISDIDQITTSVQSDVLMGANDTKIMGFDVTADDGSDLNVTSVRLEFENSTGGVTSMRLNRYAEAVSIWMDGKKVGTADVSDFSETSDVYTKSITTTNAVVKAGEDARFYVTVDANSTIDSADFAANWTAELVSVRFNDATGAILTYDPGSVVGTGVGAISETFNYEDLAASGDLAFKISKDTTSPAAQSVEADDSSETEVTMLVFKLKAEGSDMTVDSIPVTLTSVGANLIDMISEVKLMKGSDELDSVVSANLYQAGASTLDIVNFTDLADDLVIEDGDTVTLKVVATVNEIDGATLVNGDSLTASLTAAARANQEIDNSGAIGTTGVAARDGDDDTVCDALEDCYNFDVEDADGDTVVAGDRTGSATGGAQAFYATGMTLANKTTTAVTTFTADAATEDDIGKFTVNFKVTAFGNDIYLDSTTQLSDEAVPYVPGTAPGEGIVYDIFSAGAGVHGTATAILECVSNCGLSADNPAGMFFIADGDTETYRLTVTFAADTTPLADNYKVWISSINWDTDGDTDATPDFFYTSDLGVGTDVDTGYLYLNAM